MENEKFAFKNLNEKQYKVISSTPGKVLICGGYLVINPKYSGLVFTTDTFFKSTVFLTRKKEQKNENDLKENEFKNGIRIKVTSINYNKIYNYCLNYELTDNKEILLNLISLDEENNFVKFAILSAFYFFILENYLKFVQIKQILNFMSEKELEIILESDNRFYTYENDISNSEKNISVKTGLGSSSALICSLCNSLFNLFNLILYEIKSGNDFNSNKNNKIETPTNLPSINNTIIIASLFANNHAQNKIGSGFDIQSCLLGSHIFKRLEISEDYFNIINLNSINLESYNKMLELKDKYSKVTNEIERIKFPDFLKCCLISLESGSDTRILVSKVIKWANNNKKEDLFDDDNFQKINLVNLKIINLFKSISLGKINHSSLDSGAKDFSNELKEMCKELRKEIKIISKLSEVEIEPDELTILNDSLLEEDEILFSICPGAGGYDGIFVIGKSDNFENIVFSKIKKFNESSLNLKAYYIPLSIQINNQGTITEYKIE